MRKARTVGVGMDCSPASKAALLWTVENLLDDGDTVILIHVQPENADHTGKILFEKSASSIPWEEFRTVDISKQYGFAYDDEILDVLDTLSNAKKVKVMANVYWGDPKKTLCDAVEILRLHSIVVGTRCLGRLKRFWLGIRSVSSYVVTYAICPVTVVKDNRSFWAHSDPVNISS